MAKKIRNDEAAEKLCDEAALAEEAPESGASIEEMLDEVDTIITRLDSGEVPLEESFKIYERGMRLVSGINRRIDKVEKKIIEIEAQSGQQYPFD